MSVEEFFKQRAVNVVAFGQYTPANWFDPQGRPRTFACRTSRVSPYRMIVSVPVVGRVGDRLTSYFGDFGRLDGEVS
ncbi:MAG: PilZ domain-containing protein, partial [Xanthobacteraceae bacterium]